MNKHFFTFILSVVFINLAIQAQGQFTFFEAEGFIYNEAAGGSPGSRAEFYSKPWGGSLMHTDTYSREGKVIFQTTLDKQPAFVLNTMASQGHGKVMFIEARDFLFNHFAIKVSDGKVAVQWQASIKENIDISFVVQQSKDGEQFVDVAKIQGLVSGHEMNYESDLGNCLPGMLYRIKIMDTNTGNMRYITKPKAGFCSTDFILYPSFSSSEITVVYEGFSDTENHVYQMTDFQGKILRTGQLKSTTSQFEISDLSAGAYLFLVTNGSSKRTARFIKN